MTFEFWDDVRSEAEIALNYQHKFDSGSLPSGLIANWQMDGFNGSNEAVDIVTAGTGSENNLTIGQRWQQALAYTTGSAGGRPAHQRKRDRWNDRWLSSFQADPDASQGPVMSDGLFLTKAADPGSFDSLHCKGSPLGDWTVRYQEAQLLWVRFGRNLQPLESALEHSTGTTGGSIGSISQITANVEARRSAVNTKSCMLQSDRQLLAGGDPSFNYRGLMRMAKACDEVRSK